MVEHLEYFMQMAMGKIETDITTPEKYMERTQESLFNYRHLPKDFKHPLLRKEALEDLRFDSLEAAKDALLSSIDAYQVFFKENPGIETANTVFGMMDKQLWDLLNRKHFNHHFEQFGLL